MTDFFEAYKSQLTNSTLVVLAVIVLYFLTNILHKWLLNKEKKLFPTAPLRPINMIKQILNSLWLVLGIIAIIFIFVDSTKSETLISTFKLVAYLGVVAVVTISTASIVNMWFNYKIQEKIDHNYDPTSFKFFRYVAVFIICFVGFLFGLLAFPSLKGVAQTALSGAGILALIAGVSAQEALSNLVGGLFIISFKPFKLGDTVKITDSMVGTVTDITLRHTVIRNYENKMIVIPNAVMNKEKLINYDLGEAKSCERIEIGISYDSDIDLAKKIMQEECEKHPLLIDNRSFMDKKQNKPIVKTALIQFNDSSMTIRAWTWARNYSEGFSLKCDVLESIKKRFDKEGIEIPFPYRTIIIKDFKDKTKNNTTFEE
ncbi:mechanosensitive ion channel family protein [Xanthomarina sp. F1114]|uniref:mechanosensitive ion channel family protein n=1 Tax=Xanthomarina sp. F1114 TaxID=2996019 RepID=UPI00225E359A|nr:mechanosensitive ion channel family protein [Xanthomarina sp. F1114]MCX7548270.1 mechanosensitive ion channel family protein [Xanthomarina sp. F1114]